MNKHHPRIIITAIATAALAAGGLAVTAPTADASVVPIHGNTYCGRGAWTTYAVQTTPSGNGTLYVWHSGATYCGVMFNNTGKVRHTSLIGNTKRSGMHTDTGNYRSYAGPVKVVQASTDPAWYKSGPSEFTASAFTASVIDDTDNNSTMVFL